MPDQITLHLSETGSRVLGRSIFKQAARAKSISGTLLSYAVEGIWFQDDRLSRENNMLLVKWNFIDAILSEVPPPEPATTRQSGFRPEGPPR